MHPGKTIASILIAAFLFGCKKDQTNPSSNSQPDNCLIQHKTTSGDIITDEYIVAYKPVSLNGRSLSVDELSRMNADLLERNDIRATAIERTFHGAPSGLVVHLSSQQAANLRVMAMWKQWSQTELLH